MRVLLDECVPKRLGRLLTGHTARTVRAGPSAPSHFSTSGACRRVPLATYTTAANVNPATAMTSEMTSDSRMEFAVAPEATPGKRRRAKPPT